LIAKGDLLDMGGAGQPPWNLLIFYT